MTIESARCADSQDFDDEATNPGHAGPPPRRLVTQAGSRFTVVLPLRN